MVELLDRLAAGALPTDGAAELRRAAAGQLQRLGLPGSRDEAWKYTSLKPLRKYEPAATGAPDAEALRDLAGRVVGDRPSAGAVVLAGNQCLLLDAPAWVASLGEQLAAGESGAASLFQPDTQVREHRSDGFIWLNLAYAETGLNIEAPAASSLQQPLHIIYADPPACGADREPGELAGVCHYRIHLQCAAGAHLPVVEHFAAAGSLINTYRTIELSHGASLQWLQLRAAADPSGLIEHTHIQQHQDSRCGCWSLDRGSRLARHELRSALLGRGAEFRHHGLLLGSGRRHLDQHVLARHIARDCSSRQVFRAVLAGRSRVVVNTAGEVASGADGSDVQQHCAGILLSPHAEMDAKPQLEILADEVVASHGATVGQLDEEALFYLQSRGLGDKLARRVLLEGFVRAAFADLPAELQLNAVEQMIESGLEELL